MDACRPRLQALLEAVKPKIVVCVGKVSQRALFKRKAYFPKLDRALILTVTHPAAILYGNERDREWKAARAIREWEQVKLLIERNKHQIERRADWRLPL